MAAPPMPPSLLIGPLAWPVDLLSVGGEGKNPDSHPLEEEERWW